MKGGRSPWAEELRKRKATESLLIYITKNRELQGKPEHSGSRHRHGRPTLDGITWKTKKPQKIRGLVVNCYRRSFRSIRSTTPTGIRTPVFWLRTRHPRPLDDGGLLLQLLRSDANRVNVCRRGFGQFVSECTTVGRKARFAFVSSHFTSSILPLPIPSGAAVPEFATSQSRPG